MKSRPAIGVAVLVRRIYSGVNQILMYKRLSGKNAGLWSCPGGHLEVGETFIECGLRELSEEAGRELQVWNVNIAGVVNCRSDNAVVVILVAEWFSGSALRMEPHKGSEWSWHDWNDMPTPRMPGLNILRGSGFLPWYVNYQSIFDPRSNEVSL